jgi:hypothetical protein
LKQIFNLAGSLLFEHQRAVQRTRSHTAQGIENSFASDWPGEDGNPAAITHAKGGCDVLGKDKLDGGFSAANLHNLLRTLCRGEHRIDRPDHLLHAPRERLQYSADAVPVFRPTALPTTKAMDSASVSRTTLVVAVRRLACTFLSISTISEPTGEASTAPKNLHVT